MKRWVGVSAAVLALLCSVSKPAGAAETSARDLAIGCTTCHGIDGRAQSGMPQLAGRSKAQVLQQLQEFKQHKRPGSVMPQIANGYSDEQLESIAAYFAQVKP